MIPPPNLFKQLFLKGANDTFLGVTNERIIIIIFIIMLYKK